MDEGSTPSSSTKVSDSTLSKRLTYVNMSFSTNPRKKKYFFYAHIKLLVMKVHTETLLNDNTFYSIKLWQK